MLQDAGSFCVEETLRDGLRITIRAVRPDDRQRLIDAFNHLEKESIYKRFFAPRTLISEKDLDRAVNFDFRDRVGLLVTLKTARGETAIASGQFVATGGTGNERRAEVAFLVEEDFHGRGIATKLLQRLAAIARSLGYTHFEADVLSGNRSMLNVFRKFGPMSEQRSEDGILHLVFALN